MIRSTLVGVLVAVLFIIGFAAWHSATAEVPGVRIVRIQELQIVDATGKLYLAIRIKPKAEGRPGAAEFVFYDGAGNITGTADQQAMTSGQPRYRPVPPGTVLPPAPGRSSDERSAKALERIADEMKSKRSDDSFRDGMRR